MAKSQLSYTCFQIVTGMHPGHAGQLHPELAMLVNYIVENLHKLYNSASTCELIHVTFGSIAITLLNQPSVQYPLPKSKETSSKLAKYPAMKSLSTHSTSCTS